MDIHPFRSLLRLFYQYQVDKVLLLKDHKISGIVEKKQIEELMSDLTHAQTLVEIPHESLATVEDALMTLLKCNLTRDGQKVLPVVDSNGKFLGLWSKSEILGSGVLSVEKSLTESSQATPHRPQITPASSENEPNPRREISVLTEREKPSVKIQFTHETANLDAPPVEIKKVAPGRSIPLDTSKNFDSQNQDYISIKTLEALPIPMLALDTKGGVLFYNQDWVELQKKNKDALGVKNLMNIARDLMAKMAFDGELEIHSVLSLPLTVQNNKIKMRSILNDGNQIAKVLGYIFWAEISSAIISEPKKESQKRVKTVEVNLSEDQRQKYLGKTLVDLLREEEKRIMAWAMNEANQNQSNAAMLLGIPRQTFSYRYHKLFDNTMSNKLK